jgi:hypothetical protein
MPKYYSNFEAITEIGVDILQLSAKKASAELQRPVLRKMLWG